MIRGIAATGSSHASVQAAKTLLEAGANAVDALLAGFFAAAGEDDAVLLAPTVAMVGGPGVGFRVFDGRSLQPGKGRPRPRGYLSNESIPDVALVAVPRALPMLSLLYQAHGRTRLKELLDHGSAAAKGAGAKKRAAIFDRLARENHLSFRPISGALLQASGPTASGPLTEDDLRDALPGNLAATLVDRSQVLVAVPPFHDEPASRERSLRPCEVLLVSDGRGAVAGLAYAKDPGGPLVEELEVRLARDAEPVRRGVTRLAPFEVRPMRSPLALARAGQTQLLLGFEGASSFSASSIYELTSNLNVIPRELVERLRNEAHATRVMILIREASNAIVF